jgi:hypothetical protein
MPSPLNSNFLSPVGFKLSVEKIPEVTFNCQTIDLPSLSMGYAEQSTPMIQLPVLGDKIHFGDFSVEFIISEDMTDYKKLFEWLVGIGHPESLDQYSAYHEAEAVRLLGRYRPQNHSVMYSDGALEILTNNSTPNNIVRFVDLFPIGLTALPFQTTVTDIQYLTARATFKFSGFSFD